MNLMLLPVRVFKRFLAERCAQTAAALSFATLLSLVPMIAMAAAIISHLPLAETLSKEVHKFLLAYFLPEKAGGIVVRYVAVFAEKAGRLTWLGVVALAVTALTQMLTIEHTFNEIWGVREGRPLLRRVFLHLLALLLGPVLFGISIAVTTYLVTASIGLVDAWQGATVTVFRILSFLFSVGLLTLLYWKLPNRKIAYSVPLVGGILAAIAFGIMQWVLGLYLSSVQAYRIMYGAFSAIPIFMLWLYLSWAVILAGALVTADLEGVRRKR